MRCLRLLRCGPSCPSATTISSLLVLLAATLLSCQPRSRARSYQQPPPPPPPCHVDGVFQVHAQRTNSSGSVCNLDDLRELHEEISFRRLSHTTAHVDQKGQYGHQANVDAYACTVWTDRTPTHRRNVMGTTVSGHIAYRVNVRLDGSLYGTAQLYVQSNNMLVPGCTAAFNVAGRRVR